MIKIIVFEVVGHTVIVEDGCREVGRREFTYYNEAQGFVIDSVVEDMKTLKQVTILKNGSVTKVIYKGGDITYTIL